MTNRPFRLIGLNGRRGSGKDTTCTLLQRAFPEQNIRREGFADRLKLSAARLFYPEMGLEDAVAWADTFKWGGNVRVDVREGTFSTRATRVTGREFFQRYGTEAHRDVFGEDFWISAVIPSVIDARLGRDDLDDVDALIITDVRFPNEAQAIRDAGGEMWWINRPQETVDEHASERPLPIELIDSVVHNVGDIDDLRAAVVAMYTTPQRQQIAV